jgi:hypothetical protein
MNPGGVFVLAVSACLIGLVVGGLWGWNAGLGKMPSVMQRQAVEHGCASYDPQTGKWGWKPNNEVKP